MDYVYTDLQNKNDALRNEMSELYSDLQNSNDALRNEMHEMVAKMVSLVHKEMFILLITIKKFPFCRVKDLDNKTYGLL